MLKSVLYYLLFLTTAVRFADIIYLLAKDRTNLPPAVIIVTAAMVLYGFALIFKRFIGHIRLKQFAVFYSVQTAMIVFNITYMAVTCPLTVSAAETLAVGTFLDIIVNCGILIACARQIKSGEMQLSRSRY